MQELDGILDGEDVVRGRLVAVVDHGGERGGLARAGGAHHQDQAALEHHQILQDFGHPEVFELGHLRRDVAQHHRRIAALIEHIDSEAPEAGLGNREIDLQLFVEVLDLLGSHESESRLAHRLGTQYLLVDGEDLALDLDLDGRVAGEEEIRRLSFHHQFEQRLGVHHLSRRDRGHQEPA
jgi:hypothetical protein